MQKNNLKICGVKHSYGKREAERIRKNVWNVSSRRVRIYFCDECNNYHLTTTNG